MEEDKKEEIEKLDNSIQNESNNPDVSSNNEPVLEVDPEVINDEVIFENVNVEDKNINPPESVVVADEPVVIKSIDEPTVPTEEPQEVIEPSVEEPTAVTTVPDEIAKPAEPKEDNNEQPVVIESENTKPEEAKKKNSKLLIIVIILLLIGAGFAIWYFLLGGNGSKKDEGKQTTVTQKEEKKSEYKLSGNGFEDFDLAFLSLENKKTNRVYSPMSIKYMLSMLNEGTEGDSYEEIKAVLGDYIAKRYTNSANMSLANALFIKDTFKDVKDTYKKSLTDKYGAEVILDSFSSAKNMNKWIEDKTLGLLKNALDDRDMNGILFWIVNALAIDMDWEVAFDEHPSGYTPYVSYNQMSFYWEASGYPESLKFENMDESVAAMEFAASFDNYDLVKTVGEENYKKKLTDYFVTCLNGVDETKKYTESDVQENVNAVISAINSNYGREEKSTEFKLYIDDNIKVFAKNLKEYNGTTLQYVAFMPTNTDLSEFVEKTTSAKLTEYIHNLKDLKKENFKSGVVTKINGYVPRFKYEDSLDLITDLSKLGINNVFTQGKANLSKITDNEEVFIQKALHKANIEFTEKGIKAAAVTVGGGAGNLAGPCNYVEKDFPVEEIDMTFNKPYLYIIRDINSGEIWFTGTVYNPQLVSEVIK